MWVVVLEVMKIYIVIITVRIAVGFKAALRFKTGFQTAHTAHKLPRAPCIMYAPTNSKAMTHNDPPL